MKETLFKRIIRHESDEKYPYDDANGERLIAGYTIQGTATFGPGLTSIEPEESEWILRRRIKKIKFELTERLDFYLALPRIVREVLVEMAYQLGIDGLMQFKKMLGYLEKYALLELNDAQRDYCLFGAKEEMLQSKWHFQTPVRCEELADLVRNA